MGGFEKMFEAKCEKCGAVFTLENERVPECVECYCQGKDFEVYEVIAS